MLANYKQPNWRMAALVSIRYVWHNLPKVMSHLVYHLCFPTFMLPLNCLTSAPSLKSFSSFSFALRLNQKAAYLTHAVGAQLYIAFHVSDASVTTQALQGWTVPKAAMWSNWNEKKGPKPNKDHTSPPPPKKTPQPTQNNQKNPKQTEKKKRKKII